MKFPIKGLRALFDTTSLRQSAATLGVALLCSAVLWTLTSSATAQTAGGSGGADWNGTAGGAGGSGYAGAAGQSGIPETTDGSGGGGGAAGAGPNNGGDGGSGGGIAGITPSNAAGGTGGSAGSPNGSAGALSAFSGGGGGGGGYAAFYGTSLSNSVALAGGNGGDGGGGLGVGFPGAGGGGGGAAGYGAVVTGSGAASNTSSILGGAGGLGGNGGASGGVAPFGGSGGGGGAGGLGVLFLGATTFTNYAQVTGGAGGNGGTGGLNVGTPGNGGNGGNGGTAISFTGASGVLFNSGSITGGNGGQGGAGGTSSSCGGASCTTGAAGANGIGGAGVSGSNLTIVNGGSITGGMDGNGITQAYAIVFTGGVNSIGGAGAVSGGIYVQGGSFAPNLATNPIGPSFPVFGPITFAPGTTYVVRVSPTNADEIAVSGVAKLTGASVTAQFAPGTYVSKQYTILNAGGGLGGTVFSGLTNVNLPQGASDSLSYSADNVYLNLTPGFANDTGLNINQQNVANALTSFLNATGSIPSAFFGLSPAGLTQVSGELGTGSQQTTFDAMNLFMGAMLDPFNRGTTPAPGGSASGYASEGDASAYASDGRKRTSAERDAYAMFTKAPPAAYDPRWSVWASGFGGSQTTDGNATLGSNTATSSIYGTAVGADYRISPNTVAGFALAGGGTNFSVANSGSGHSDLFQAGAFIRHTVGPAYVSAALAYGWQDITTNRTVTVAGTDLLRAQFDANAFSGRLEGGYRFVTPWIGGIGITPYAAAQFTAFDLPAYAEQAIAGSNAFALAYGAKDVTDTRSELGIRTDKSFAMTDGILTLRGRIAWAHDFDPDRSIAATFQTLPGASFVVNGAAQAPDSALVTAGLEKKWRNGWSAAATFEGEFSDVTRSYAGKGVVRYQW